MAIIIDAKLKMGSVLPQLQRLQQSLDKINATIASINSGLGAMASNGNAAARALGSASRSGSGSSSGGSRAMRTPPISNPYQAMRHFGPAAASGNPYAVKMFNRASGQYASMQRGQARAQMFMNGGGSPGAAMMMNAIGSTRFGKIGGKVIGMPLGHVMQSMMANGQGGQLAAMMGGGGGMGAEGLAVAGPIGVTVAALAAVGIAAKMAADSVIAWTRSMVTGGGTFAQAKSAQVMGEALGVDVGGIGRNLGSGYGPAAAAGAGVNPFGGPFGDNEYNQKGLKVLDWIRKSKSMNEARRRAEMAGSPEAAQAYLLGDQQYNRLRNQTGSGEKDAKGLANLQADWASIKADVMGIIINNIGPLIHGIAVVMDKIAGVLRWFDGIIEKIRNLIPGARDNQKAITDNTKAVDENTKAVREGTYGGGARAQGAVPRGMAPYMNPGAQGMGYGVI